MKDWSSFPLCSFKPKKPGSGFLKLIIDKEP